MEEHPQARFVVQTLHQAGFIAYYAGGWVRDFLLQHPSDDIDIATNAPPETIQALFPHTVPIGISFGIILVVVDHHPYEVATFRRDLDYKDGRRPSEIAFATAFEDAQRRDFTINGMFYDPIHKEVLDYVGGQEDLKKKIIRAIGNPHQRIKEDRLRMMRACRLSCRFGFAIEPMTAKAILDHAKELFPAVAIERIYQELEKGHSFNTLDRLLIQLHEFGLLPTIFPALQNVSLEEIRKRVSPLHRYPKEAPLIASLMALFPEQNEKEALELCKRLKVSKVDQDFVSSLFYSRQFLTKDHPDHEWAHFYARRFTPLCLEIIDEKTKEHRERQKRLQNAIDRIRNQNPVLKAEHLIKEGIAPGKKMGILLKEAEKISIDEAIEDPRLILEKLKRSIHW